jgi:hypothetical protein
MAVEFSPGKASLNCRFAASKICLILHVDNAEESV